MKKGEKEKIRSKVDKIMNDIARLDMEAAKADPKIRKVIGALETVKKKLEKGLYWNPYEVMVKPPGLDEVKKTKKIKKS
tara:strand:- start:337 stop:573 length:237 start_codon:yes stop_codon:yes gene_type:complete